jgi:pyridoxamine 5'-phosphate oxidase family protein
VVVDDIVSLNPWKVRGIEVRGEVEVLTTGGETVVPGFDPEMFRITPKRIASWGLETEFRVASNARSVN